MEGKDTVSSTVFFMTLPQLLKLNVVDGGIHIPISVFFIILARAYLFLLHYPLTIVPYLKPYTLSCIKENDIFCSSVSLSSVRHWTKVQ